MKMSRLKLETIENSFGITDNKKYMSFKNLPRKAYCPNCHKYTAKKFLNNRGRNFITGTIVAYGCGRKECDLLREYII